MSGTRLNEIGSPAELNRRYFGYPSIQVYLGLLLACVLILVLMDFAWRQVLAGTLVVWLSYPLIEYLLHRFLLHSHFLYRSPLTAALWKRIHFDHHSDPQDLRVLLGALSTTLPPIFLIPGVLGYLVGAWPGVVAAIAAGLLNFLFYEYLHCIHHLRYSPRQPWLKRLKRHHLMHHHHNETVNFGITSVLWDRLLGTFRDDPRQLPRSATVNNLGYDSAMARRYPWVRQQTVASASGEDTLLSGEHRSSES